MHNEEFHTIPLPEDHDPKVFIGSAVQLYGPPPNLPITDKIPLGWRLALWNGFITMLKYVARAFPLRDATAKPIKIIFPLLFT